MRDSVYALRSDFLSQYQELSSEKSESASNVFPRKKTENQLVIGMQVRKEIEDQWLKEKTSPY